MLDAISFADTLHGWCSSLQGMLLHSADGGLTWVEQAFPEIMPIAALHAVSATTCWAAGYNGMILKTEDGGRTWEKMQAYATDYTRILFDARGTGWAIGKRGAVVRSTDGGKRWRLHHLSEAKVLNGICFPKPGTVLSVGSGGTIDTSPIHTEKK
jgi:photosystem II stability/assembly factor-like uncharacterized protein